jgi:RNA polymerase sigma-70 factor (ECF subfamily)
LLPLQKPKPLQANLEHIITGCLQSNSKSQELLYKYCYPEMLKVCSGYAVDNNNAAIFYNDAMFKVFNSLQQYKGEGSFMGWVRRIVVNTCIDHCRKNARYAEKELNEEHTNENSTYPEVYNTISGKEIVQLIKELPVNTALVFNLYVMEGYKHSEISERLGISVSTSKWHLSEGRRLLKDKLDSLLTKEFYLHAI